MRKHVISQTKTLNNISESVVPNIANDKQASENVIENEYTEYTNSQENVLDETSFIKEFLYSVSTFTIFLHNNNNFTRNDVYSIQENVKEFILDPILKLLKNVSENFPKDNTMIYNAIYSFITNCKDAFHYCKSDYQVEQWLKKEDLIENPYT